MKDEALRLAIANFFTDKECEICGLKYETVDQVIKKDPVMTPSKGIACKKCYEITFISVYGNQSIIKCMKHNCMVNSNYICDLCEQERSCAEETVKKF